MEPLISLVETNVKEKRTKKERPEIGLNWRPPKLGRPHLIPTASCLRCGIAARVANLLCRGQEKRTMPRYQVGDSGLYFTNSALLSAVRYSDKSHLTRGVTYVFDT